MGLEINIDNSGILSHCANIHNGNLVNTIIEYFKKERGPLEDYINSHAPEAADFVSVKAGATGERGNYYEYELMYQTRDGEGSLQIGDIEKISSRDLRQ